MSRLCWHCFSILAASLAAHQIVKAEELSQPNSVRPCVATTVVSSETGPALTPPNTAQAGHELPVWLGRPAATRNQLESAQRAVVKFPSVEAAGVIILGEMPSFYRLAPVTEDAGAGVSAATVSANASSLRMALPVLQPRRLTPAR